jgi:hypothetical protein
MTVTRDQQNRNVDFISISWNPDPDDWGLQLVVHDDDDQEKLQLRFNPEESQRLYEFLGRQMDNGKFEYTG